MGTSTLYPIKGSVSWNKGSGLIQSSGLVPPGRGMEDLGVGDEITLVFQKKIRMASGATQTTNFVTTPSLTLFDWRCVSNGWVFNARNEVDKDIVGEYVSMFQCLSQYQATKLNTDISSFLETLIIYDESHTRETTSPYASPSSNWWRLSDITPSWSIPDLADLYITTMGIRQYASSISIVQSFVPLVNQLFWLDGFNKTVSMLPSNIPTLSTGTSNVSMSTYLDLTSVDNVDLMGNKGDPQEDPRAEGVGGLAYIVEESAELESGDEESPLAVQLRDKNSAAGWLSDSSRRTSQTLLSLYGKLGDTPLKMDEDLVEFFKKLVVMDAWKDIYGDIRNISFDYNIEYFNLYNENQNLQKTVNYSFSKCHPNVSPFTHVSPLMSEVAQFTVRSVDLPGASLASALGVDATLTPEIMGFTGSTYSWLDDDRVEGTKLGQNSKLYEDFSGAQYKSGKSSVTTYNVDAKCSGNGIPYLFERTTTDTVNRQAGIFMLNLDSMFWVTPGGENNLKAIDPSGKRVWLGPYDGGKRYTMQIPTMLTLFDLFGSYGNVERLHEALCVYVQQHSLLIKEGDIVVAAICDKLSEGTPYEYQKRFSTYYSTVKHWFDGQLMRLSGLQYSYQGSHPGMSLVFEAITQVHGEAKMDKIVEKLFPGIRMADAKDSAGGAYCKDMVAWMGQNGIFRVALGESAGEDTDMIKYCDPLEESSSSVIYMNGSVKTIQTDLITDDMHIQDVPTSDHPELVYVAPKYIQVSTIEQGGQSTSNQILTTKVLRWDTAFSLRDAYKSRLAGRKMVMASRNTDYSDNAGGLASELADCMSDITIRNFKLSVSGEGTVTMSRSQLSMLES